MASEIALAFSELREQWLQLSKDYAQLLQGPYDPAAAEAHLENLRRHRERLRFLRATLRRPSSESDVH